jgi:ubiquinone/menaquinone biosynthesis C-methylase UbiE
MTTEINSTPKTSVLSSPTPMVSSCGWDSCAEEYEKEATVITGPAARRLLDIVQEKLMDQQKSQLTLADIACGSGALAIEASKLPHIFSTIIGSDYSTGMCAVLDRKSKALQQSQPNSVIIRTIVADAQNLTAIPSNSVDIATSTFGIMMVPNLDAGLGEMIRITKPGGLIGITTWRSSEYSQYHNVLFSMNKYLSTKAAAATDQPSLPQSAGHLGKGGMMQLPLNTEESIRAKLESLGLRIECIESYTGTSGVYNGVDDFWDRISRISPMPPKSAEQNDWAKEYLATIFGKYSNFRISFTAFIALARKV